MLFRRSPVLMDQDVCHCWVEGAMSGEKNTRRPLCIDLSIIDYSEGGGLENQSINRTHTHTRNTKHTHTHHGLL